ncbi:hypothetical protein GUJ93_ZPchr0014g46628 [Zizania palustris]|uniref:ZF-HD dimerization-type domain-containing protein n=1 Tax=Zizania palustris TaxID=103762 RepID=A0A8J5SWI5_ZIZPA|nr:hypothetical protein GUJ93_ZPchr0014g46628 [Zizania palustris]
MEHLSLVPHGGGKYKECMRNHAAVKGGQAFDGCGEYMPAAPDSLKCAACGCHRSFHRRAAAAALGVSDGACASLFFHPPPHSHSHHAAQ